MRKLLVKIFNLVYIFGAGLSIFALATKPIVNVEVTANFSAQQVGDFISKAVGSKSESEKLTITEILNVEAPAEVGQGKKLGTNEVTCEVKYSDTSTGTVHPKRIDLVTDVLGPAKGTVHCEGPVLKTFDTTIVAEGGAGNGGDYKDAEDVKDKLTPERIAEAFEGGLQIPVTLKVEAKYAYDLKNKEIIKTLLKENIYTTIDSTINKVTPPLRALIKSLAADYAKDVLRVEVADTISKYFEGDNAVVSEEQIDALFDTIYDHVDGKETTVTELANAILGKDKDGNPIEGTSLISILDEMKAKSEDPESGVTAKEGETYDPSKISSENIADQMVIALQDVPGLVEPTGKYVLCDPAPTEDKVNEAIKSDKEPNYYFKTGEDTYTRVTAWDPAATEYYKEEMKINDVNQALSEMINAFVPGSSSEESSEESEESKAVLRKRAAETEESGDADSSEEADEKLRQSLTEYIYSVLQLESFENATAKVDPYVGYILLGVIVLFALPWAFFAVQTLLRTLRKDKCWARGGGILWWTWITLIFGILLTYGLKYIMPIVENKVPDAKPYLEMLTINARTGCLIPSFVFCAFVVMLIPYKILVSPLKRSYKLERRYRRKHKDEF